MLAGIYVSVDQGVNYDRHTLPGGEVEIVFSLLVPRQQVTLSYLYFAPITFNVINMPVTSDEGLAKVLNACSEHRRGRRDGSETAAPSSPWNC